MSGICGVVFEGGRSAERRDVETMLNGLARRGPDGSHVVLSGSVGFGHASCIDDRSPHIFQIDPRTTTQEPVVSHLVLLTGLPVCHWYGGDWATGGYFHDLSLGTWLIRKV